MGLFDFFKPASGATMEDIRRENNEADPERVLYFTGASGLNQHLGQNQTRRFAAARAPQVAAVDVLGQRAQTLEGGAAMLQAQAAREQAQAQAMQAPGAILGGQIGAAAAQGMGALEQEAAARQAAYLRGVGALGEAAMQEAEERRRAEQVLLQDTQARYAAAMQQAHFDRQREAEERAASKGAFISIIGAGIGAVAGGPKGAAAGYQLGSSVGSKL